MKNKKVLAALIGIIILALVAGIALWKSNQADKSTSKASTTIRVGSKDFTESLVVSEIYSLALEDNGYKVDRVSNISSSLIHKSLVNDEIDLYPEYTGTALLTILGDDMETDPDKVYQTVKKEYEEKYNLTWLNYSEANDSSGLAMRKETADKYNIKTISDLQKKCKQYSYGITR